jgi:ubiquinone biosynthesis protein UbiJ
VELKVNDIPRRSRDVVDDVCDQLDFTKKRLERLEERLNR